MSTVTIVLLVILVILIAAVIALYFFGKKAQKKTGRTAGSDPGQQADSSMLIIDKKADATERFRTSTDGH